MANPVLARSDDLGRRFYTFGDPPEAFWSVTTIISGGVPKHLQAHYAKMAAELAYASILERGPYSRAGAIIRRLAKLGAQHIIERQARGELVSIKLAKQTEKDLALRWLKGAADRHRDAAAERGSAVHAEAEQLVLTHARESARLYLAHETVKPWPDEIAPYQRSFTNWIDDYHPEFLAAEATVFNRTQAYAGTLDIIARIELPGGVVIVPVIDIKSGRAVYPEVALQNAAYARGEFIGHPDGVTEIPMIPTDSGAVLHLTPKGYEFRLVRIDGPIFDAFCFAREVYRFVEETSKTVLLQDLTVIRVAEEVA
jgi:hypothetical protein